MAPKRATKQKLKALEKEKMDRGDQKRSKLNLESSNQSPAFNTRRPVRSCTMISPPFSTSKHTSSVARHPYSFSLAKKTKDATEESPKSEDTAVKTPKSEDTTEKSPKSEAQDTDHEYANFYSFQLNDHVIDDILDGKYLKESQLPKNASPSRSSSTKRGDRIEICDSDMPVETVLKTIPMTKAIPNTEVLATEFTNQTEGSKECNLTASEQYMNNLKPSGLASVPSMITAAEQTSLEDSMVTLNFAKQTEKHKEFNLDATLQYIKNLKQTGLAPVKGALVASNLAKEKLQGSSSNDHSMKDHISQTHSLDLTNMAAMCNDDESSRDEVGSHSSLVTVQGYRVKEASAPFLEAIFLKYGDIAANCSLLSNQWRSRLLEDVCNILTTLQETDFLHINQENIQSKIDCVNDLARVNMQVLWLHQRLTDILEAKQLVKQSSTLKEEKDNNIETINEKERKLKCYELHILALEEKINATKKELAAEKVEAERINERHRVVKGKVRNFHKRSLIDGLV